MNVTTNLTDIDSLLDSVEDVDEPVYISYIESSLLKVIPKFFKAIVTLLICGLLLGVTFLLINLWKRGCRTHRKLEETSSPQNIAPHSVVVTPPPEDDDNYYRSAGASSSLQPLKTKNMNMKVPKQHYLRRASGPFGSDVLSFVGEQYTMKNIEKELKESSKLHHHGHGHGHGHGHHQHHHSGASSAGGSSIQNDPESDTTPKLKWGFFRGSKE